MGHQLNFRGFVRGVFTLVFVVFGFHLLTHNYNQSDGNQVGFRSIKTPPDGIVVWLIRFVVGAIAFVLIYAFVRDDLLLKLDYIKPDPNTYTEHNTHTEHNTEHNTNTTSTGNEPPEAAGPTKDDMEGLFEMTNEELFPESATACQIWFLEFVSVAAVLILALVAGMFGFISVMWKSTGVFPDLIEHYKKSHQKNEKWVRKVYETRYNRMLKLRASQEGLEARMTDDEIMDKVLGTSRGFKPGRGRKPPNSSSSSSVRSYPAPPPSASQARLEKFVVAHNEQVKDILSQSADKNIELRFPVPLNPNQFMDDVIDEGDEGDDHEDAAESGEE
nr:hypothetical protein [Tanacetum cinerariifolium]